MLAPVFHSPQYVPRSLLANQRVRMEAEAGAPRPCGWIHNRHVHARVGMNHSAVPRSLLADQRVRMEAEAGAPRPCGWIHNRRVHARVGMNHSAVPRSLLADQRVRMEAEAGVRVGMNHSVAALPAGRPAGEDGGGGQCAQALWSCGWIHNKRVRARVGMNHSVVPRSLLADQRVRMEAEAGAPRPCGWLMTGMRGKEVTKWCHAPCSQPGWQGWMRLCG